MKKNVLLYIIGGVFIALAIAALIIFIVSTNGMGTEPFKLEGTWKVAARYKQPIDDEYMVFGENTVADYREGKEAFSEEFEWTDNDTHITIPALDKKFFIHKKTDNIIVLVEPGDTDTSYLRWELIRIDEYPPARADIKGEWTVNVHSDGPVEGEQLIFTDTTLELYREGKLSASSAYNWNTENGFYVDLLKAQIEAYRCGNKLMLIEYHTDADTGVRTASFWELTAKD